MKVLKITMAVAVFVMLLLIYVGAMNWAKLGCGAHDYIGTLCRDRIEQMWLHPFRAAPDRNNEQEKT